MQVAGSIRRQDHACVRAFPDVVDESVESMDLPNGINGFHLEPQCRICRNDQVRTKVNDLLATGASYAIVLPHSGTTMPSSNSVIG